MRDGIFRSAPSSAPWRDFGNSINSDADWREGGDIYIKRALIRQMRDEFDPSAIRRFVEAIAGRQLGLFETARSMWGECAPGRAPNSLEGSFLDHCERLANGGRPTTECIRQALADAVQERSEAEFRQLMDYLQGQRQSTVASFEKRGTEIIDNMSFEELVDPVCRGELPSMPPRAGKGLDAEEDLL